LGASWQKPVFGPVSVYGLNPNQLSELCSCFPSEPFVLADIEMILAVLTAKSLIPECCRSVTSTTVKSVGFLLQVVPRKIQLLISVSGGY
jgi:hypothetical protein